jgi:hypothetical protein
LQQQPPPRQPPPLRGVEAEVFCRAYFKHYVLEPESELGVCQQREREALGDSLADHLDLGVRAVWQRLVHRHASRALVLD